MLSLVVINLIIIGFIICNLDRLLFGHRLALSLSKVVTELLKGVGMRSAQLRQDGSPSRFDLLMTHRRDFLHIILANGLILNTHVHQRVRHICWNLFLLLRILFSIFFHLFINDSGLWEEVRSSIT